MTRRATRWSPRWSAPAATRAECPLRPGRSRERGRCRSMIATSEPAAVLDAVAGSGVVIIAFVCSEESDGRRGRTIAVVAAVHRGVRGWPGAGRRSRRARAGHRLGARRSDAVLRVARGAAGVAGWCPARGAPRRGDPAGSGEPDADARRGPRSGRGGVPAGLLRRRAGRLVVLVPARRAATERCTGRDAVGPADGREHVGVVRPAHRSPDPARRRPARRRQSRARGHVLP